MPPKYFQLMRKYGEVLSSSIVDLVNSGVINRREVIILDPQSSEPLSYYDLSTHKFVVVGGILGDHPPRGRTKKLISDRMIGVETRNIGAGQYSIDGSVYYVNYLWTRGDMRDYEFVDGVTVNTSTGHVYLPYRYPLVDGKPLLAPGLLEYLRDGELPDYILREAGLTNSS